MSEKEHRHEIVEEQYRLMAEGKNRDEIEINYLKEALTEHRKNSAREEAILRTKLAIRELTVLLDRAVKNGDDFWYSVDIMSTPKSFKK